VTDERLEMVLRYSFGVMLLGSILAICMVSMLGKVEEATSAGLKDILPCLTTLAGVWANSVLGGSRKRIAEPEAAT